MDETGGKRSAIANAVSGIFTSGFGLYGKVKDDETYQTVSGRNLILNSSQKNQNVILIAFSIVVICIVIALYLIKKK